MYRRAVAADTLAVRVAALRSCCSARVAHLIALPEGGPASSPAPFAPDLLSISSPPTRLGRAQPVVVVVVQNPGKCRRFGSQFPRVLAALQVVTRAIEADLGQQVIRVADRFE